MKTDSTAYINATMREFLEIESGEYREKIRFVQLHRNDLNALPMREYVMIMDAYAEALFEMGRFNMHLQVADHLIEMAIMHNIKYVNGRDLYFETLFQKAASLYNLNRNDEAIHILKELLKMEPLNDSSRLFLINCFVREKAKMLHQVRKVSLVAVLASAVIIALELTIFRPFLESAVPTVEIIRNSLFLSGAGLLIAGELFVRYRAVSRMYTFVNRPDDK